MNLALPIAGVSLMALTALARLWWVLRDRGRRRRARSWDRWWATYRLRLPVVLMARWAKGRMIAHRSDTAGRPPLG